MTKTPDTFIIECPGCGVKNRIKVYSADKLPVCAKCKTALVDETKNDAHAKYSQNLKNFYDLPGIGLRNEK